MELAQEHLKSMGHMFRHVINSSDFPTGQLMRKLPHHGQNANMKIEKFCGQRRISPHDETSGDKRPSEDRKKLP